MKRISEKHIDKTIIQALKTISNPFDLIAFLFAYMVKELLVLIIIILLLIIKYPRWYFSYGHGLQNEL